MSRVNWALIHCKSDLFFLLLGCGIVKPIQLGFHRKKTKKKKKRQRTIQITQHLQLICMSVTGLTDNSRVARPRLVFSFSFFFPSAGLF
jgi:hypothetical protein